MEYAYLNSTATWPSRYLWPQVQRILKGERNARRIFEIGCGNGATARMLTAQGYDVQGVDTSASGVAIANHPGLRVGSAYDDLAKTYGRFPIVLSLEVIEHLMEPRRFAKTAFDLLEPGGIAIISTPFHGYWKNLALALTGSMDAHFTALWDGGHIKFFSERTLGRLLKDAGFDPISFRRAGRVYPFAKSMIAIARKG